MRTITSTNNDAICDMTFDDTLRDGSRLSLLLVLFKLKANFQKKYL